MNVLEQKTALKRYGFDDGDPLLTWLNSAMHEIENAFSWPWLEVLAQVTVLAGASALVLPGTAFKVMSMKDLTHPGIKLGSYDRTRFDREVSDQDQSGTAQVYVQTGLTTIQLWPVPDEPTTYQVVYQRELADLVNDTDVPAIPTRLHYPMVHGAAYIALSAENEEDRSKTAQSQFNDAVARAIATYSRRDSDEPDQVVDAMGYGDTYTPWL